MQEAVTVVRTDYHRTSELGVEGLQRLKRELLDFENEVPGLVAKYAGADHLWTHRGGGPTDGGYVNSNGRCWDDLSSAVQAPVACAGNIFEQFGFAKMAGVAVFGWGRPMSRDMITHIKTYDEFHGRFRILERELPRLLRQKGEAEAVALWNKVR